MPGAGIEPARPDKGTQDFKSTYDFKQAHELQTPKGLNAAKHFKKKEEDVSKFNKMMIELIKNYHRTKKVLNEYKLREKILLNEKQLLIYYIQELLEGKNVLGVEKFKK